VIEGGPVVATAVPPALLERMSRGLVPPPRPSPCREAAPGTDLQAAIDDAPDGSALCLAASTYAGPITIRHGIRLWGPPESRIRSAGEGTTVRIVASDAALLGVTVDGSGDRYDHQDAAIAIGADGVIIEGVTVEHATFGVVVERARAVALRGNRIIGTADAALGLRGDAIRLWETYDTVVEANVVSGSRDIVVWYSSRNRLTDNVIVGSRYGTHLMYSHGNLIAGNQYVGDVVGIFAMYSRELEIHDNLLASSGGAAGIGIGLKESSGVSVHDNLLLRDTVGIFIDRSPFTLDEPNRFERNAIRLCGTGIVFHSSPQASAFVGNSLRTNLEQVRVDGGGDAREVEWRGNDFDDYVGYDLDGDGIGDVPYELRSLTNRLTATYPALTFLHGTPALALVEAVSYIVPLFRPKSVLADPAPRLAPLALRGPA
jgi:nitrous oxidase accessory protein